MLKKDDDYFLTDGFHSVLHYNGAISGGSVDMRDTTSTAGVSELRFIDVIVNLQMFCYVLMLVTHTCKTRVPFLNSTTVKV